MCKNVGMLNAVHIHWTAPNTALSFDYKATLISRIFLQVCYALLQTSSNFLL